MSFSSVDQFLLAQAAPVMAAAQRLPLDRISPSDAFCIMRNISIQSEAFREVLDLAPYAMQQGLEAACRGISDETERAQRYSFMRSMCIFSDWYRKRLIGCYIPGDFRKIGGNDWWKDYSADFILDNFKPQAVYISLDGMADAKGRTESFGGFFAGLDYCIEDDEIYLWIQQITRNGEWRDELFHRYPLKSGEWLGDIVQRYAYDRKSFENLKTLFKAGGADADAETFYGILTQGGEAVASYTFPFLIGMLCDWTERRWFVCDPRTNTVRTGFSETDSAKAEKGAEAPFQVMLLRLSQNREGGIN